MDEIDKTTRQIETAPRVELFKRNETNFTYHPPKDGQVQRYAANRAAAKHLANQLAQTCPPSRELSLALTKIEEAMMWANAAIARNEA